MKNKFGGRSRNLDNILRNENGIPEDRNADTGLLTGNASFHSQVTVEFI
jgi:hypothetical protein